MIVDTPEQIKLYQMLVLRKMLQLEMKGLKMSKGRTAYSSAKQLFNINGSRQKVLKILNDMIETTNQIERKINNE